MVNVISPLSRSDYKSSDTFIVIRWVIVPTVHWWWKSVAAVPDEDTDQCDIELTRNCLVVIWWEDEIDLILFQNSFLLQFIDCVQVLVLKRNIYMYFSTMVSCNKVKC